MKKIFFLFVGILFVMPFVSASCAAPNITLLSSGNRTYVDGNILIRLVFSADPPVSTSCSCPGGNDCGMDWQTDFTGTWTTIPKTNMVPPPIDLNCSNMDCDTGKGYPIEDNVYSRYIACSDQNVYHIRGYQAYTNTASTTLTLYCYPKLACVPPLNANFDLNTTCNYSGVPVFIDRNFNVQSAGRSNNTNANFVFTYTNQPQKVMIWNGGRIDLNKSAFVRGFSQSSQGYGPGSVVLLLILTVPIIFRKYWFNEAIG